MKPSDNDEAHSTILLADMRSPGVVTLSGHDRVKNWDVKSAKGQTGASSSLNGDPVGGFRASFYIADDSPGSEDTEFDKWDRFQAMLEASLAGPKPSALPVYHPDLARNHFTEVAVKSIGGLTHDGRGGAIVVVDFIEYKPPKPKPASKAKAKPSKSTAGAGEAGETAKPDPNAAAKRQLAGLLDEARKP